MRYVISSTKRNGYLNGFYSNGGFTIGDVFAFSNKSYTFFSSEIEAQEYLIYIKCECMNQSDRWGEWLDKALSFTKSLYYRPLEVIK
jgi:uncharacterized protein (DUF2344 family)